MSLPIASMAPCDNLSLGSCSTPKNPWHKLPEESFKNNSVKSKSFLEVMSEDMAEELQERENKAFDASVSNIDSPFLDLDISDVDTSSDFLLAVTLQQQYNRQHNDQIQREEKHFNKNSNVSLSFCKYRVGDDYEDCSSDDEAWCLDDENRAIDLFEENRRTDPLIPACGYTVHNNKIVTKHDSAMAARKNAEKVMNFPPGINTGDGGGFDMRISNKVYNKLAKSAQMESRRKQRVKDKVDKATAEKALDPKTRLLIYKLVNNSTLESVNSIISTGKESVVFHATGGTCEDVKLPEECAVKVFKTTLAEFKTREKYIREDYRFKDRMSKNNNRMMIQMWAEKEFHNLRRLEKARVPAPSPLLIRKHALLMTFVGADHVPAPKIKHVSLSREQWNSAYHQVTEIMEKMFGECRLVHGDLSEYNILWFDGKCWVIDVGQAVEPVHPSALRFLYRDCSNVVGFFKCKGVEGVLSPLKMFEKVSGIALPGPEEDAINMIEEYENHQEMWHEGAIKGAGEHFEFVLRELQKRKADGRPGDHARGDPTTDDLDGNQGEIPSGRFGDQMRGENDDCRLRNETRGDKNVIDPGASAIGHTDPSGAGSLKSPGQVRRKKRNPSGETRGLSFAKIEDKNGKKKTCELSLKT